MIEPAAARQSSMPALLQGDSAANESHMGLHAAAARTHWACSRWHSRVLLACCHGLPLWRPRRSLAQPRRHSRQAARGWKARTCRCQRTDPRSHCPKRRCCRRGLCSAQLMTCRDPPQQLPFQIRAQEAPSPDLAPLQCIRGWQRHRHHLTPCPCCSSSGSAPISPAPHSPSPAGADWTPFAT